MFYNMVVLRRRGYFLHRWLFTVLNKYLYLWAGSNV